MGTPKRLLLVPMTKEGEREQIPPCWIHAPLLYHRNKKNISNPFSHDTLS